MFTTLVESSPRRARSAFQAVVSVSLHAAVGVGAVWATMTDLTDIVPPIRLDTIPIIVPDRAPVPPRPTPDALVSGPAPALPANPVFVPPPGDVTTGIPDIEPGPAVDPSRFVLGSTPSCLAGCGADSTGATTTFVEATVDEPARILFQPSPKYPPILKQAGIAGRVVVEFVVDTLGSVEHASLRVVESSNRQFESSAVDAVVSARFTPARIGGRAVRQLVRQGIAFKIE